MSNTSQSVVKGSKSGKRGRPRKYEFPSQLVCSISGKITKTNPTQCSEQIKKSGLTLEEYIKTYVCRSARKQIKLGLPVTKVEAPRNQPLLVATPDVSDSNSDSDSDLDSDSEVEIPVGGNKVWGDVADTCEDECDATDEDDTNPKL